MGEYLNKEGLTRFKENMLTEVDKRIASGGGGSSGDFPTREELIEATSRVSDVEVNPEIATLERLQTGLARVESSYLPLEGGTITGGIVSSVPVAIKQATSDSYTTICGGKGTSDGARLVLTSKGDSDGGQFKLYANDGTSSSILLGDPDGTLKWGGKVIAVIESSDAYCVRFSNGTQICSGNGNVSTSGATFTFPLSFSDAPIVVVGRKTGASTTGGSTVFARSVTTTTVNVYGETSTACHYIAFGRWK